MLHKLDVVILDDEIWFWVHHLTILAKSRSLNMKIHRTEQSAWHAHIKIFDALGGRSAVLRRDTAIHVTTLFVTYAEKEKYASQLTLIALNEVNLADIPSTSYIISPSLVVSM